MGNVINADVDLSTSVELVAVSRLRPSAWNPRTITNSQFKSLCRSIQRDPALMTMRPIIATKDGVVVAGNMRLRAVQELGWSHVPAVLTDMDDALARERAVRDNGSWGEWAEQELADLLTEISARGADIESLGFDKDEIERLLGLASAVASDDRDFDPTPPLVPQTCIGDLLLLGPHRLVCGDSRDPSVWSHLMESAEDAGLLADGIWTDPPYGVDLAGVALPSRGDPTHLAIAGCQFVGRGDSDAPARHSERVLP